VQLDSDWQTGQQTQPHGFREGVALPVESDPHITRFEDEAHREFGRVAFAVADCAAFPSDARQTQPLFRRDVVWFPLDTSRMPNQPLVRNVAWPLRFGRLSIGHSFWSFDWLLVVDATLHSLSLGIPSGIPTIFTVALAAVLALIDCDHEAASVFHVHRPALSTLHLRQWLRYA